MNVLMINLLIMVRSTYAHLNDADLARSILDEVENHLSGASDSIQGRQYGGYGGCTDSFSVFGFLAFLLALLDLILDLQGNMNNMGGGMGGRTLRSAADKEHLHMKDLECQKNVEMNQATSACYSLLRGFLNALASTSPECANKFMCEGAEEAATAGPIGEVIANVGSINAGPWLMKVNASKFAEVEEAGQTGAKLRGCVERYSSCFELPSAYRYPAVYRGPQLPTEVYQPVLQKVMDIVRESLLK